MMVHESQFRFLKNLEGWDFVEDKRAFLSEVAHQELQRNISLLPTPTLVFEISSARKLF